MDFLSADSLPWLHSTQQRLRAAVAAQRLPHSLLLLSPVGLGGEQLANWITALTLCESPEPRPCGVCRSCLLLRSDSHPDSYIVRLEEDARQIKVEQVRGLIESLALKSYRGGYKVAVIEGAEMLNANSHARVLHVKMHVSVYRLAAQRDRSAVGVLHRVGNEIQKHLPQLHRIGLKGQVRSLRELERETLLRRKRLGHR